MTLFSKLIFSGIQNNLKINNQNATKCYSFGCSGHAIVILVLVEVIKLLFLLSQNHESKTPK